MPLYATAPLFAWIRLEDHPQRATGRDLLAALPDADLLDGRRRARGHGRADDPVEQLWGVVLCTGALRHLAIEACLAEWHRNVPLDRRLGIATAQRIPRLWNVFRFLEVRGPETHLTELRKVFDVLAQRRGRAVPDWGSHTAADSTGLNARAKKSLFFVASRFPRSTDQSPL